MNHLSLRQKLLILIKECGFPAVADTLAELAQTEAGLINLLKDSSDLSKEQLTLTSSHLREAAAALQTPQPYHFDIPDPIHQEAVKRFLKRLSPMALQALGTPPKITVRIQEGELTPVGAKASRGRYEAWEIVWSEELILMADTLEHARALELAKHIYLKAAKGLFQSVAFQWIHDQNRPSWAVPEGEECPPI